MIPYFLMLRKVIKTLVFEKKGEYQSTNLTKRHRTALALALLKILIQERARLLVSLVDLKTLEKHSFVITTSTLHLLLLLVHGRSTGLSLRGGLATSTSTKASSHGSDSLVSNGGTSTESHTLSNGGSNSREHATRFGRRGGRGGTHGSLGRGATGCGCATAASTGATSSSASSL